MFKWWQALFLHLVSWLRHDFKAIILFPAKKNNNGERWEVLTKCWYREDIGAFVNFSSDKRGPKKCRDLSEVTQWLFPKLVPPLPQRFSDIYDRLDSAFHQSQLREESLPSSSSNIFDSSPCITRVQSKVNHKWKVENVAGQGHKAKNLTKWTSTEHRNMFVTDGRSARWSEETVQDLNRMEPVWDPGSHQY